MASIVTVGGGRHGRRGWMPIGLLLAVAVVASIVRHGPPALRSMERWSEAVESVHGDELRLALRPWLRTSFEAADTLQPHLGSLPVVITGSGPFFVAYRLAPQPCFRARAIPRFEAEGLRFHQVLAVSGSPTGGHEYQVIPALDDAADSSQADAASREKGRDP